MRGLRSLLRLIGAIAVLGASSGEAHVIDAPEPSDPSDRFGRALAFVGDRLAVGAPGRAVDGHAGAGAVYLYDAAGNLVATRTTPAGRPIGDGDELGFSLAAAGDRLVVGAPGAEVGGLANAGRVYVFDADGGAIELDAADRAARDRFGHAVAALGTSILVGAPGSDADAADGGAVYVFDAGGALVRRLTLGQQAAAGDALGYAVAAHGTLALAGAPRPTTTATGAAFLFDVANGAVVASFASPTANAENRFGAALGSTAGDVLVGAPFEDAVGDDDAGAVFVFDAGNPLTVRTLRTDPAPSGSLFGATFAVAGTDVVVGAPAESTNAEAAGAAFRIDEANGAIAKTLREAVPVAGAFFGSAVAASNSAVAVGAPGAGRVDVIVCDDGVRDPGEGCDMSDDAACPNGCNRVTCRCGSTATCGDGVVKGREECDDGNLTSCDGCSGDCHVEGGAGCGDGALNETCGEQCDDGNADPLDGCSPQCRFECAGDGDCTARIFPNDAPCVLGAQCSGGECAFTLAPKLTPCGGVLCCSAEGHCNVFCASTSTMVTTTTFAGMTTTTLPGRPCEVDDDCNDRCHTPGRCDGGVCTGSADVSCDDGDPCTIDSCSPSRGCTYELRPGCCSEDADCDNACRSDGSCKLCNYCSVFSYGEACCDRALLDRPRCRGGVPADDGTPCAADNDGCTQDVCTDGACTRGEPDPVCRPNLCTGEGTPCEYAGDACFATTGACRATECVAERLCDVTTCQAGSAVGGASCVRSARAIRLVVACAALADDGGTARQRRRASCRARAQSAGGKAIAKSDRRRLDADGRATLTLPLTKAGRRLACAESSVDADVRVTLRDRRGIVRELRRSIAASLDGATCP